MTHYFLTSPVVRQPVISIIVKLGTYICSVRQPVISIIVKLGTYICSVRQPMVRPHKHFEKCE